jgi:hypothetical protein
LWNSFAAIDMDYEVQRATRHCSASGRELVLGEPFYSVLVAEGANVRRYDYAVDAWAGPPPGAIGWWKSQVPDRSAQRRHWAPNDVMLHFFDELAEQPDRQDMRYVLALLLVRRRVLRLEETETSAEGREVLLLFCPRRDATYKVPAVVPQRQRIDEIQEELARLLQ